MLQRSLSKVKLVGRIPNPSSPLLARSPPGFRFIPFPCAYSIKSSIPKKSSLLDYLRTRSQVDCDTLDTDIGSSLGPFVDCTSNQAIAFFELSKPKHADTLKKAAASATDLDDQFPEVTKVILATEIATILAGCTIIPHMTGCLHLQVNPFYSHSTSDIKSNAYRLLSLCNKVASSSTGNLSSSRLCLKIPSTWAGLQACRDLEHAGIKTLATTLFSLEQAELAGEVGCTYIAPYVNELRVHFEDGYRDPAPALKLCVAAQAYFSERGLSTRVLPASLTSVKECMTLAGADHITIAPPLLRELADVPLEEGTDGAPIGFPSLYEGYEDRKRRANEGECRSKMVADSEGDWRIRFTRAEDGRAEKKLVDAINIFCDMQVRLEELVSRYL